MLTDKQGFSEDYVMSLIKPDRAARNRQLTPYSDMEIAEALLMLEPELKEISIDPLPLPKDPFVLMTKEGASFEGVITAILDNTVELRQADNKIIHVFKSAVAAVRRA